MHFPMFLTHAVSKSDCFAAVLSPGIERCFLIQETMFLSTVFYYTHPVNALAFLK